MLDRVGAIGARAEERLHALGGIFGLAYAALKGFFLERPRGRRVVLRTAATQIYFTAIEPLPFFALIAVIFGIVVIVEADKILPRYALQNFVPNVVAVAIVREIAPLMVAMGLIGRSGTAIATELGYMRVNQEIDALEAAGINIDYFVVLPRIVGVTIATVSLTVAFSCAALVGGFVVAEMLGAISVSLLFQDIVGAVTPQMIGYALLKGVICGLTIAAANCYHGLSVSSSFTEIPQATGRGVIHSLAICLTANALISVYAVLGL